MASGFETARPTPSTNQYFKTEVEWQAPGRGTGLKYKVYQQEIDLDAEVSPSINNTMLMENGQPPRIWNGKDYEEIQLHHSRQDGRGTIYEVSKSTHLNHSNENGRLALHPYPQGHPDYPVNRPMFEKDRNQYWKDRLNQLQGE